VSLATLFEGFDTLLLSLALPYLGVEFGVDSAATGRAVGTINLGTVLAFVPVRLADRYGRRPVLLVAIAGYTLATVATAATRSLAVFVAVQVVARMFMVTEIGLAYVLLSEEMPARLRGRANAFMVSFAGLGGILAALAFAPVVGSRLGWRGLYLLGGALLPLFPVYWLQIRETQRFRASRAAGRAASLLRELGATRVVFRRAHLRSTLTASALWFCISVWTGATVFWFTYYAVKERGWEPSLVGSVLPIASAIGLAGYAFVGVAMDLVGRRFAAVLFLALGGVATAVCFTAEATWLIAGSYVVVMLMQAVWSVIGTITSEIFPTEVRATASAVSNNLIGRLGMVLSGFAVGALSVGLSGSVGNAVALLALAPIVAIPIVLRFVPETRGRRLEEIAAA
jgi:putative MFS transporter